MTVKLDSNLAEELVKFKLKSIQDTLKTILEKSTNRTQMILFEKQEQGNFLMQNQMQL